MSDETAAKSDTAVLRYSGGEFETAVHTPTEGSQAVDVSKLLGKTGLVTLDEGYVNTGSTKSAITFLNGEKGIHGHLPKSALLGVERGA